MKFSIQRLIRPGSHLQYQGGEREEELGGEVDLQAIFSWIQRVIITVVSQTNLISMNENSLRQKRLVEFNH